MTSFVFKFIVGSQLLCEQNSLTFYRWVQRIGWRHSKCTRSFLSWKVVVLKLCQTAKDWSGQKSTATCWQMLKRLHLKYNLRRMALIFPSPLLLWIPLPSSRALKREKCYAHKWKRDKLRFWEKQAPGLRAPPLIVRISLPPTSAEAEASSDFTLQLSTRLPASSWRGKVIARLLSELPFLPLCLLACFRGHTVRREAESILRTFPSDVFFFMSFQPSCLTTETPKGWNSAPSSCNSSICGQGHLCERRSFLHVWALSALETDASLFFALRSVLKQTGHRVAAERKKWVQGGAVSATGDTANALSLAFSSLILDASDFLLNTAPILSFTFPQYQISFYGVISCRLSWL